MRASIKIQNNLRCQVHQIKIITEPPTQKHYDSLRDPKQRNRELMHGLEASTFTQETGAGNFFFLKMKNALTAIGPYLQTSAHTRAFVAWAAKG